MPIENLEDQGLEKNPDLELAHLKFLLTLPEFTNDKNVHQKLTEAIKKDNMAPWYELICKDVGWKVDHSLLKTLKAKNEEQLKILNEAIEDAEKNLGEMEVREAYLRKAEYYSRIGDKENTVSTFRQTYDKTVSLGHRLDIIFHLIRTGLFFLDHDLITRNIDKAKSLIEEGGDWDRRNRLKVYQGAYCMAVRDFKTAANLFLDTVSTFTSYELMDYKEFVRYTVYTSIISLPRNQLRDKLIHDETLNFLNNVKTSKYKVLFICLDMTGTEIHLIIMCCLFPAEVEVILKRDYYFNPHYRYYVREMKILAYTQLLESYRSLTLQYMAEAFGVTIQYIDEELSTFIATGRLHCKIDRVGGIVETNRPDLKNAQFNSVVKQGDLLLNRVQKLSRVINI
ncbi:unnamed protein product [Acanthoscelides obtectus]|uniref:26S proteasome non-ATPase regulatory subunit 6 n=1 Tax=Acanthoscelides obtectus TaxID=200917 RepID=A0A9P0PKH5_ACAOB|nr:unnamed protein product [Acanthoscelides obtectus]CAK1650898.1 26S proteasome non-ATPase regulatory subunit 6 [Acanthoscelides obtectus]